MSIDYINRTNIYPNGTNFYRWFNLLVYHLHTGKLSWSTKAQPIKESIKVVQAFIQKKTGLKVDQSDSSCGTTSTGNVAHKVISENSEYLKCLIEIPHRSALTKIHNQLAAILLVINYSEYTEKHYPEKTVSRSV